MTMFWRKLFEGSPDTGSGRGGPLGTPRWSLNEEPPSSAQDSNWVVSGGDLVGPADHDGPEPEARRSRSRSRSRRGRRSPVRVIRVGRTTHRLHG